jgi:hypothetical protein
VRVRLVRSIPNQPKESKMPEWVHTISGWVIVHKDHVTLFTAGVSAVMATAVVFLTAALANDNRRLRKAGTEPDVVAYLLPDQRHLNMLNLVVANVGRGPARNVSLEFVGDIKTLYERGARLLSRARMPIHSVLPQDERFVQIFGNALDIFDGGAPPDFLIKVHFENSAGRKNSTEYRASIKDFEGLSRSISSEHEAAEALKQIASAVRNWTYSDRLRVETITSAELQSELKAIHDAALKQSEERKNSDRSPQKMVRLGHSQPQQRASCDRLPQPWSDV